jgi:hypothetical protein
LKEAGYEESMLGISLSYTSNPERSKQIAPNLAHKGNGHSKFLECIELWIDVTAPRYIWQEFSTYRHSSVQSESTMHTIMKKELTQDDFENDIPLAILNYLNLQIVKYKMETFDSETKKQIFLDIKNCLPEGFLQRRIVHINYATLKNIYYQRINHKLTWWKDFLNGVLSQIEHQEFIIRPELPLDNK